MRSFCSAVLAAALVTLLAAMPADAQVAAHASVAGPAGAQYRPGEVVVRYAPGAGRSVRAAAQRAIHAGDPVTVAPHTRVLRIEDGESVAQTLAELRATPGVESATANYVARASAIIPRDPGTAHAPAGWTKLQWNFLADAGVDAPDAWQHLIDAHAPGGRGVTVAVLDTGVAYANRGRYRRSPDFSASRFVAGRDFVDGDPYANDENGHGTHVAGTIGESTGNAIGVTGLAYGVKIMPVRVLDRRGEGDSATIAAGLRWAAAHGAQVINLSFEFGSSVTRGEIPDILSALRYARHKRALVVGASGNAAATAVAYPARSSDVLSVGATTQHLCQADYSNEGSDLDLVAPGGGPDAMGTGDPNCQPSERGRDVYQMTFRGSVRSFGLPGGYMGTSMAAPHVAATAALVIASRLLGRHPSPAAVEQRLEHTARDLGAPGFDARYGHGLVDAARATDPTVR